MGINQLQRRNGESDYQYHKRLLYGKLIDKSLSDYDYSELSRYIYGKEYSDDVARRMMYGSMKTINIVNEETLSRPEVSEDVANSIESRIADLKKAQQQYYDQRREYNRILSHEGRLEHLYDVIATSVERMPEFVTHINTNSYDSMADESEAVIVFSDWHYGMNASNEFNKFDTKECAERVHKVVSYAIDRIKLHNCKKATILVLGDLIHGAIHTSTRVASDELVVDQLMNASELLANAIYEISKYTDMVDVFVTYGNHGRIIPNKSDSIHRDNFERIVPWWLEQRFTNVENVTINKDYGNEFIVISPCGHSMCATHGDLDTVRQSPTMLSTLLRKSRNIDIEYVIIGDKHHEESFEELGIKSMLCGSLCGADDYANSKRLYSEPSQLMLIVNSKDGVDAEYRIKC